MQNIILKRDYNNALASDLTNTTIGEISIPLIESPDSSMGWIVIEPRTENEEVIFYHRSVGNTVYAYGINRNNPVFHASSSAVITSNGIDYINYVIGQSHEQLYIYKKSVQHCVIKGGKFFTTLGNITINDLDTSLALPGKSLSVNAVNYVYIVGSDFQITTTQSNNYYEVAKITTSLSGDIISLEKSNTFSIGQQGDKGDPGNDAPDVQFQYSIDGSDWHSTYEITDKYIRSSTDDGSTWSSAMKFIGDKGDPGNDAPDVQFQYSIDGSGSWHSTYVVADKYIRSSVDGGSTWSSAMKFIGDNGTGTGDMLKSENLSGLSDYGVARSNLGLGNVDNTSDINKPVSTAQALADTATLDSAKAYADGLVVGLLDDRGSYNASSNVFPSTGGSGTAGAILKGDMWFISVAGTLGGVAVEVGDSLRALVDSPGQTASNWSIIQVNINYVPENSSNKSTNVVTDQASNIKFPSVKAVYDWATGLFAIKDGAQTLSGVKTFEDTTNINGELQLNDSGGERASVLKFHAKNQADNGGVDWKFYADADGVVIGTRKFGLWGYPLKPSDGSYGGYESFITASFPTYDGNTTYTKQIDVHAPTYFLHDLHAPSIKGSAANPWKITSNGSDIFLNTGTTGQAIYLRPNGDGSSTGQVIVTPTLVDIQSSIKISGGSPGLGKVLTSDANGYATWTDIFNNYGQLYNTYTDFNSIDRFGPTFVKGTANGPSHQGANEYYVISEGLGSEYLYSQYVMQMAIPRNVTNPNVYIRYREAGTWSNWKISSGTNTNVAANYTTSVTMDWDAYSEYSITAQAGALLFNNPSGYFYDGQKRMVRIKDNGTARALTYGTQFASGAATLPTTTIISKKLWIGFEWDSTDSKWYCIATGGQP